MPKNFPDQKNHHYISPYQEEIHKAGRRIGKNDAEVINWFLNFAQCDLTKLSQGQLIDLAYEINWWVDSLLPVEGEKAVRVSTSFLDWKKQPRFGEKKNDWHKNMMKQLKNIPLPMDCLSSEEIKILQGYASSIIHDLKGGVVNILLPSFRAIILKNEKLKPVVILAVTQVPGDQFYRKIGSILLNNASNLHFCLECKRVFFADRKNKVYCSTRCQTTAATRKFRKGLGKK